MLQLSILVISIIGNLTLGVLAYRSNPRSSTNKLFFLLIVDTVLWLITNYFVFIAVDEFRALIFIRWVMFFAAAQIFLLFLLVHTFPYPKIQLPRKFLIPSALYTAVVMLVALSPYLFTGIKTMQPIATPTPGPGIVLFVLLVLVFFLGAIYLLIRKTRSAKGLVKHQLFYLALGIITTFGLVAISDFVLVVFFSITSLAPLTPAYTLILVGSVSYAIIAHQLFDIRVIIRRTVVYSGLLGFTLGIYSLVVFVFTALFGGEGVFQTKTFLPNFIAAVLIAIGFEPIRRYLTRVTDKYLFKGEYDPQAVLAELGRQLSASLDMRQAAQSLVTLIKTQLRLGQAAVITFTVEGDKVLVKDAVADGYEDPAVLQLAPNSPLLQQMAKAPHLLITDILRRDAEAKAPGDPTAQAYHKIVAGLEKLKVSLAFPVLVDKKAIGVFLVGEKLSGDIFMRDEIQFLTIVAHQTANSIEKARFWEEDQMKSEFVSIASHELLTPTAAIKGYLSMILHDNMGKVDTTARGFLEKVYESSDRLAKLVDNLLNVSRIEAGRLKINKTVFSIVEVVKKAADELQVNAKQKGLDLALVPPKEALPNVCADRDHVYRVLINLIGNAIKYTSGGWIRCFVSPVNEHSLAVAVMDSGVGIPPEAIPHLFEKFYRADRKAIAGIPGSGLGLYVSKKIIDLMGGHMWVESTVGEGTTFFFTVPIATGNKPVETNVVGGQPAASPGLVPPVTSSSATSAQPAQTAAAPAAKSTNRG